MIKLFLSYLILLLSAQSFHATAHCTAALISVEADQLSEFGLNSPGPFIEGVATFDTQLLREYQLISSQVSNENPLKAEINKALNQRIRSGEIFEKIVSQLFF